MKKKILIFSLLIVSSIFFMGCNKISINSNPQKETEDNGNVNFPSPSDKDSEKDNDTNSNTNNEEDKKITRKICRIYAFNREELQLYYFDEELTIEDNALVTSLTKALKNNLPDDSFLALSDKAQITSAKLDKEKGILTVVFSENFLQYMVLGSSTESGLVSSLVNTYGYNYDVDKVAIYFGDTLYTSLKGTLEEGYFNAHFSEAKEYIKE